MKVTSNSKLEFVFSVDKRYIFTIDDLDAVAPAYEYFIAKLTDLSCNQWNIYNEELSVEDVKQYFCYERSQDLCIIRIKVTRK